MSQVQRVSEAFYWNFFYLRIFGVWPGVKGFRFYKYYSAVILIFYHAIYITLMTISLFYTPSKIELVIQELVFYFTEIGITWKVITMIVLRENVQEILDIIDSKEFSGEDDITRDIIEKDKRLYVMYYKVFAIFSNMSYWSLVVVTLMLPLFFNANIELPICRYYFLSDEIRKKYYFYFFFYQTLGMFIGMMSNVNNDSLIPGFILMAVTQFKLLNYRLKNLKLDTKDEKQCYAIQDEKQLKKLNKCLRHYETILRYCDKVQSLFSLMIFIQIGISSFVICIILCSILFGTTSQFLICNIFYSAAMILEIFTPSYVGSQLTHESSCLSHAAFSGAWIDRSPRYKRHLKLFMERVKRPIEISGLGLFPLSLENFTSICKTAYSFFALVRNVQMRQNN